MGKALISKQILLSNSLRKCMEISRENLYLDMAMSDLHKGGVPTRFFFFNQSQFRNEMSQGHEIRCAKWTVFSYTGTSTLLYSNFFYINIYRVQPTPHIWVIPGENTEKTR